jgi:peroxiredoxin
MPCNAEAPRLQRLYERVKSRGGLVVGVAMANDRERGVVAFRDRHHLTYPLIFDRDDFFDSEKTDVPSTILIDVTGVIRWMEDGYEPSLFATLQDRFLALQPREKAGRPPSGLPSGPSF